MAFLTANIPLKKVNNIVFFFYVLIKYANKDILDKSTLYKNYLTGVYEKTMAAIRNYIFGKISVYLLMKLFNFISCYFLFSNIILSKNLGTAYFGIFGAYFVYFEYINACKVIATKTFFGEEWGLRLRFVC